MFICIYIFNYLMRISNNLPTGRLHKSLYASPVLTHITHPRVASVQDWRQTRQVNLLSRLLCFVLSTHNAFSSGNTPMRVYSHNVRRYVYIFLYQLLFPSEASIVNK